MNVIEAVLIRTPYGDVIYEERVEDIPDEELEASKEEIHKNFLTIQGDLDDPTGTEIYIDTFRSL